MKSELKKELTSLAQKYETSEFLKSDPSQFLRWYKEKKDIEIAAFITAMLSFGSRSQFIPKIKEILELADKDGGITQWILHARYEDDFVSPTGNNERKFYRFYSYDDLQKLFFRIKGMIETEGSLGKFMQKKYEAYIERTKAIESKASQAEIMCSVFGSAFLDCDIVPKGKSSACKRIHMFLRWMVRDNSPVDIGIWTWLKKSELLIPLDTHVLKEAEKMGILPEGSSADLHAAKVVTEQLKEIWPEDPCKGDFALFGLGVA